MSKENKEKKGSLFGSLLGIFVTAAVVIAICAASGPSLKDGLFAVLEQIPLFNVFVQYTTYNGFPNLLAPGEFLSFLLSVADFLTYAFLFELLLDFLLSLLFKKPKDMGCLDYLFRSVIEFVFSLPVRFAVFVVVSFLSHLALSQLGIDLETPLVKLILLVVIGFLALCKMKKAAKFAVNLLAEIAGTFTTLALCAAIYTGTGISSTVVICTALYLFAFVVKNGYNYAVDDD